MVLARDAFHSLPYLMSPVQWGRLGDRKIILSGNGGTRISDAMVWFQGFIDGIL
jgi:hypothetical protein